MEILTYVLANIIGILLIVFVVWWFWLGKKTKAVKVTNQVVDIKVADGVYTPDAVRNNDEALANQTRPTLNHSYHQ